VSEPSPLMKPEMSEPFIEQLKNHWLPEVAAGRVSYSELAERILQQQYSGQGVYEADVDRRRRCGFGEVIFSSGKSSELIATIARRLIAGGEREVLITRVESDIAGRVCREFAYSRYDMLGRTLRVSLQPMVESFTATQQQAAVVVVCAGSTDLPVAREALETLAWMGVSAVGIYDVGVAGPYRLLAQLDRLRTCAALVVVAGMEGALASVVGGLVSCPVIAVPTSVGYGANLQGITTLMSMLSSCAAGVTVVNVDAGFKGGYVAGLVAHQLSRPELKHKG
jgi:pyridinium-3,5-biscarboxylic acid mononucleotide synthase